MSHNSTQRCIQIIRMVETTTGIRLEQEHLGRRNTVFNQLNESKVLEFPVNRLLERPRYWYLGK